MIVWHFFGYLDEVVTVGCADYNLPAIIVALAFVECGGWAEDFKTGLLIVFFWILKRVQNDIVKFFG